MRGDHNKKPRPLSLALKKPVGCGARQHYTRRSPPRVKNGLPAAAYARPCSGRLDQVGGQQVFIRGGGGQ